MVYVECVEDGVVVFESVMVCVDEVFCEGVLMTGWYAVFTLRLKLWAEATMETDDESGFVNEFMVMCVYFVFLVLYVLVLGVFDG